MFYYYNFFRLASMGYLSWQKVDSTSCRVLGLLVVGCADYSMLKTYGLSWHVHCDKLHEDLRI